MNDECKNARMAIRIRREQLSFDGLTAEEQEQKRRIGMDPYEPENIRMKKQAAELEERKKFFNKLTKETRDALTALGVNPNREPGELIRRECGLFIRK